MRFMLRSSENTKGVIKHDRRRVSSLDKHFRECKANQNGNLLLGPVGLYNG